MIKILSFTSLVLLIVVQGCIPVPGKKVVQGERLTKEDIHFIKPSVTTRSELIDKLGDPDWHFDNYRIIAYTWRTIGAYILWPEQGWFGVGLDTKPISKPYVLLITFDSEDRVSHFDLNARLSSTVRKHAKKYAKKQGLIKQELLSSLSPLVDQSIIYIYRPGGSRDAPLLHAPLVSINGKKVAELLKGTYKTIIVPPGHYSIAVQTR